MRAARAIVPGAAIWVTGLPASGKTTLAVALVEALRASGAVVLHLDSDALRPHAVGADGFDTAARERFYGLIVYLARLATEAGALVVISATAHRRAWRDAARAAIPRFVEVFLDVDATTCRARDPKGLWRAAAAGVIDALPGAGVDYEAPPSPEVRLDADTPRDVAVGSILAALG